MNRNFSEQKDWNELLNLISNNQLTPVIGNELFKFRENSKLMAIEDHLTLELFKLCEVTPQPSSTLYQAVDYLENVANIDHIVIDSNLRTLVTDINFEFPLLLEFIKVSKLNYYINTALYDNILDASISKIRNQKVTLTNFLIKGRIKDCSDDLENLENPFVFNVFGSLLKTVDPPISEAEMLEYTISFEEKMKEAPFIRNSLNKHLLFIGCSYPDWMVRFILRLLSTEPFHVGGVGVKRNVIVVNDKSDLRDAQFDFLKKYGIVTYDGSTEDFVQEFSRQWKQKNPSAVKTKIIFLSYMNKDREAVENLKKAIENIIDVTCWYDMREVAPGDEYDSNIATSIRDADLFIPLISDNSLNHLGGYVQKEWITAQNVNIYRKDDGNKDKFLMPIVIDTTSTKDARIQNYFPLLSIGKVEGGNPSHEFIMQVKATLNLV